MDGSLLEDLTAVADATRSRMLVLLERNELTVSELCAVLQLPQSTVSRHLKILADANWVASRREGTSRYYQLALDDRDTTTRRLWSLLRDQVADTPGAGQDARRLKTVLARRRTQSQQFFDSVAGQWDKLRESLFGSGTHFHALSGLLDDRWVVGDLGCGTGALTGVMAPFVTRVIGIDRSGEMLQAARRRLRDFTNVDLRRSDLESLPIANGDLDAATLLLVLHHVSDPAAVLAEAARALKPGGRLVITDMLPHDHEEYRQQMGHVWLGFSEDHVHRLLTAAGFEAPRVVPMPTEPEARGPALFVASARKASGARG
jgi:ubiquinone/menaquinone biosynthesis C-methylase UbiE/DNA-binding transcriptional ArsR family regulator